MTPRFSMTLPRVTNSDSRRLTLAGLAVALSAAWSVVACGEDCSGPPPGMLVVLKGGTTTVNGEVTCDRTLRVQIRLGEQSSTLNCSKVDGADCHCTGGTTPGQYEITVIRESTVIDTSGLTVPEESCELVRADFTP